MPADSPFTLTTPEAVLRVRARERDVHAFVNLRLDDALAEDRRLAGEPRRSPLHGVPFSLKDEWETVCLPTTGGSWRHRARRSPADSAVFEVFRDAGAVLLGKTNLPDMGITPESTSWVGGATRNPFDPTRTAGGSSGGAAAAVAGRLVGFDWGTDIGGSIRQPAAFCGILGLRLSSETWPIDSLFPKVPAPLAWMCGQGPLTRTLPEMHAVLDVARPRLRRSIGRPFELRGVMVLAPDPPGLWPSFAADVEPRLRAAGLGDVSRAHGLPSHTAMRDTYNAVWAAHLEDLFEADPSLTWGSALSGIFSAVLFRGRFGDKRWHPSTAQLLLLVAVGRLLYRDKRRALAGAQALRDAFGALWDRGWLVATPVAVHPPPRIGEGNKNPHILSYTMPGNIADSTALSIPWGTFEGGLPRSMQLMGPPGCEAVLLEVAGRLGAKSENGRAR